LFLLAGASLLCSPAWAATLSFQVLDPDGQPAANAVVEVLAPQATRPAMQPVAVISQRDLRFVPLVTAVPAGATVRFLNQDGFDHHLRSLPAGPLGTVAPARSFELRLPGGSTDRPSAAEIGFDQPGLVVLGCHLHSSMRGHLYIGQSPLLAVTDANGQARVAGVPDGRVEVRLWHPEQLLDQAPLQWPVTGDAQHSLRLNFKPPKARPRRS
jgi:plastocyanin